MNFIPNKHDFNELYLYNRGNFRKGKRERERKRKRERERERERERKRERERERETLYKDFIDIEILEFIIDNIYC